MKPQDLKFTKEELENAFGKKMTREHFLKQFRQMYGNNRKAGDDDGRERSAESNTIRFA